MALQVFTSPSYNDNAQRLKAGQSPCVICGKGIDQDKIVWGLHETGHGTFLLADGSETVAENADMGFQPIGPECRRKHPELKPYLLKNLS